MSITIEFVRDFDRSASADAALDVLRREYLRLDQKYGNGEGFIDPSADCYPAGCTVGFYIAHKIHRHSADPDRAMELIDQIMAGRTMCDDYMHQGNVVPGYYYDVARLLGEQAGHDSRDC